MAGKKPEAITGGCLCGGIRYNVSFTDEGSWPPMVSTCQCSICRKWTGCLVSHDLIVKKTQISPDWSSFTSFAKHESSPGTTRAFCSKCGSGVAWFNENMPDDVIIFVGTIDEEFLLGTVIEDTVKESEHGKDFKRETSYAKALTDATMAGNLYWQNAIPGVTDHLAGPKFLQHYFEKIPLPETEA